MVEWTRAPLRIVAMPSSRLSSRIRMFKVWLSHYYVSWHDVTTSERDARANLFCRLIQRRTATVNVGRAADKVQASYKEFGVYRIVMRHQHREALRHCFRFRYYLAVKRAASCSVWFCDREIKNDWWDNRPSIDYRPSEHAILIDRMQRRTRYVLDWVVPSIRPISWAITCPYCIDNRVHTLSFLSMLWNIV